MKNGLCDGSSIAPFPCFPSLDSLGFSNFTLTLLFIIVTDINTAHILQLTAAKSFSCLVREWLQGDWEVEGSINSQVIAKTMNVGPIASLIYLEVSITQ